MKTIMQKNLKFIGTHILSLVLTLFYLFIFSWVIEKWGFVPFSVLASLTYLYLIYFEGWNWGRLEGKKYNETKENPLRALAASAAMSVICLVFAVLVYAKVSPDIVNFIAKIWYFPFIGFYAENQLITPSEILLTGLLVPLAATLAYFAGMKNFSLLEKLTFMRVRKKSKAK